MFKLQVLVTVQWDNLRESDQAWSLKIVKTYPSGSVIHFQLRQKHNNTSVTLYPHWIGQKTKCHLHFPHHCICLNSFSEKAKKCIQSEFINPEANSSSGLHLSFYRCVLIVISSKTRPGSRHWHHFTHHITNWLCISHSFFGLWKCLPILQRLTYIQ